MTGTKAHLEKATAPADRFSVSGKYRFLFPRIPALSKSKIYFVASLCSVPETSFLCMPAVMP